MAKPLILVVDDDRVVTDAIANTLKDAGKYEVVTAYSAKEALYHLEKNKILFGLRGNRVKLIFLDIKMPDMDGLQLLEKIRREFSNDIGISMLTAYEDAEKWDRATSGFVINYIKKPFDEKELLETAEKFFSGDGTDQIIRTFEKHIAKRDELKKK